MAVYTEFNEVMFIHIPKCAGEAISHWLTRHACGRKDLGKHSTMSEHTDIPDETYVFTCVRHPYTWVYSGWSYLKKRKRFRDMSLDDWVFDDLMLEYICGKPQHEYIDLERINHIMKYEKLKYDFIEIQDRLKNNSRLDRRNASPKRSKFILTERMKKKIHKTYEKDFEIFQFRP